MNDQERKAAENRGDQQMLAEEKELHEMDDAQFAEMLETMWD